MTAKSVLFGILIGPLFLVPAIVIGALGTYFLGFAKNSQFPDFTSILFSTVFALPVTYFITLIVGLPLVLVSEYFNKFNLPCVVITSLIPATVMYAILSQNLVGWLYIAYFSISIASGCYFVCSAVEKSSYNKSSQQDAQKARASA